MAKFRLDFILRSRRVNRNVEVNLSRPHLQGASSIFRERSFPCIIDTGAAVSVVGLGVHQFLNWRSLNSADELDGEIGNWMGLPCDFGETEILLFETTSFRTSVPCSLSGKFVLQPSRFENDIFVLLGMNFLMDNEAKLSISGAPWNCLGSLEMPDPPE